MTIARFQNRINWKTNGIVLRDDNTVGSWLIRVDALEQYEAVLRLLIAIVEILWPQQPLQITSFRLPEIRLSWSLPDFRRIMRPPEIPTESRRKAGIFGIWVKHFVTLGRLPR